MDSAKGHEYKGVVDLVAIKRNNRKPDNLTVMLVQVGGGPARLKREERKRLRQAIRKVGLVWNVAEKPDRTVRFRRAVN